MSDSAPAHPLRKSFRKALSTARKRAARKAGKLQADADACAGHDAWLARGEAIKANLATLRRGQTEATLPDPSDPERILTVELDPRLGPMANARRYFKKARKLRDGLEHKRAALATCRAEADELADLLDRLLAWEAEAPPEAPPPGDLVAEAKRFRVHVQGLSAGKKADKGGAASVSGVRTFTSADGWTLLVGRSARDNDRLTLKIAKGRDWWFHVAHYQGSHVVAKAPPGAGKGDKIADKKRRAEARFLPQETLLDGATLAVYYSKARGASKAEVHYTEAKHVGKARKAPPGQVTLARHEGVLVRMEGPRLERLLATGGGG